ncbi:putative 7 alpha-cephem-methoxylase [Xylariaceae sp. FL1651]|nr:putative 7 alpha-cephem-methoxylase [Xylariaceae sp. FL1651]
MTDTIGQFNYFQWQDKFKHEKPYYLYVDPPPGHPNANFTTAPGGTEVIRDVRGKEHEFNLDDHGFSFTRQKFPLAAVTDVIDETIQKEYLPSLEGLIKDLVKQDCDIIWFDWRCRSSNKGKTDFAEGTKISLEDRMITLAPIRAVHVDQTPAAAIDRVHRHVSADRADQLLRKRFRILNVWRPMAHPVENFPLAFCDGSSVPSEQLVEVDIVRKSFPGESYYPLESNAYKWYYLNNMSPDEVLFMKMYDSNENVKAHCCPHASFTLADDASAKPRESIEVRALVFTDS